MNFIPLKADKVITNDLNRAGYSHYVVQNELNKNGFNIEKMDSVELRQELGQPVYGLLIVSDKI